MSETLRQPRGIHKLLGEAKATYHRFNPPSAVSEFTHSLGIIREETEATHACLMEVADYIAASSDADRLFDLATGLERRQFRKAVVKNTARHLLQRKKEHPGLYGMTAYTIAHAAGELPQQDERNVIYSVFRVPNEKAIGYAADETVRIVRLQMEQGKVLGDFNAAVIALVKGARSRYLDEDPISTTGLPPISPLAETQAVINLRSDIQRFRIPSE